jgi:hypothetical protein
MEELLDTVFSVRSVPRLYKESTQTLPNNDMVIFPEPLPSIDKGIFTKQLPSNNKGDTQTHTEQRDLISLLLFFQNKEIRLKK